jgi:hypothetical protein
MERTQCGVNVITSGVGRSTALPLAPPALLAALTMYGNDDEVFDSVTWESPAPPAAGGLDAGIGAGGPSTGPGFRQSASEGDDTADPHAPRWEGYLRTSVRDPTKELAETKDAYVSYLVSAEVCISQITIGLCLDNDWLGIDEPANIFDKEPIGTEEIQRLWFLAGESRQRLPGMRCAAAAWEAAFG